MKRNFFTAAAMMALGLFVASTTASAADVKFGGELRPRLEIQDRDFNSDTGPNMQINSRIRLDATANINEETSAFIQLQAVGCWGDSSAAINAGAPSAGGNCNGNASSSPGNASDVNTDVGIHQAYFTLKNFYTLPVDLQVGRQEVVLDGHRLLGNTGWTPGAQTHDAARLTHSHDNMTLAYVYSSIADAGTNTSTENHGDQDVHVFWGNFKGILGGALSLYYVYFDNDVNAAHANDFSTVGFRQAGNIAGFDYRGEFYYQFGGGTTAANNALVDGLATTNQAGEWEREAYMFGVRVGRKLDLPWKPSVTLWYDYLSGTSEQNIQKNEVGTFDTLFDTGHKFYGFMDHFLTVGVTARAGSVLADNTRGLGLQDMALKLAMSPMEKVIFKADFHSFFTAESAYVGLATNSATFDNGGLIGNSHIGEELDLTLIHKYNANTTLSLGYSHFFADALNQDLLLSQGAAGGANNNGSADWAYVMMDVKF